MLIKRRGGDCVRGWSVLGRSGGPVEDGVGCVWLERGGSFSDEVAVVLLCFDEVMIE